MNQYNRLLVDAALCCGVLLTALSDSHAQTLINLGTQSRNIDFTGAQATRPIKTGSTLPTTCSTGDFFLNTTATAGQNLFSCLSNSWSIVGQTAAASVIRAVMESSRGRLSTRPWLWPRLLARLSVQPTRRRSRTRASTHRRSIRDDFRCTIAGAQRRRDHTAGSAATVL